LIYGIFYESNYTHSPAALSTPGPGKAIIQDATIKVTINHLLHIGPEEAILPGKGFIIDLSRGFKMFFKTLIISRFLRFAGPINSRSTGHGLLSLKKDKELPNSLYFKLKWK